MLVLHDHQREAVDKIVNEPTRAALIASEMGTGKTLIAVEVARALGAKTVLVIAPPGTKGSDKDGWQATVKGQEIGLDFRVIDSSKKGVAAHADLAAKVPGVYFISREFFHLSATEAEPQFKPAVRHFVEKGDTYSAIAEARKVDFWKLLELNSATILHIPRLGTDVLVKEEYWTKGRKALWSWSKVNPDLVIYDEVQAVTNRYTNGAEVLRQQMLRPGFKIAMSGTPQGNKFKGIWSVCRWLWPDAKHPDGTPVVDRSQWRWAAQWAVVVSDHFAGKKITAELEPGAFVASLPCYIRKEAEQVEETLIRARVDLTPAQRALYTQMERDALMWLQENPSVADVPIVQRLRLRQITLGEVSFDENGEIDFALDCASGKADACFKVIDRHPGEQILFWCDSKKFAKVLAARLPGAVAWHGDVSHKQRDIIKQEFIKGKHRFLVATIPAMAEGVDGLQKVCHTQVWLNKSDSVMLNAQAAARLNRQGQEHAIMTYELVSPDTADDDHFNNMVQQTVASRATLRVN